MPSLLSTNLMKDTRQQFVDSFLSLCTVEIFSPGEELLHRGSISSDLFLLVEGTVETSQSTEDELLVKDNLFDSNSISQMPSLNEDVSETDNSSSGGVPRSMKFKKSGEFLNELCELRFLLSYCCFSAIMYQTQLTLCNATCTIFWQGFFTESPESDTVRTRTACKVLVMSRSHYRDIAADHPGSAGVVLRNLLSKFGDLRKGLGQMKSLTKKVGIGRLVSFSTDVEDAQDEIKQETSVAAIRDLIEMHISKQKDEHTTWFCFAASRGDTATISNMCEHGFDPNSSDCEYSNLDWFVQYVIDDSSSSTSSLPYLLPH